MTYGAGNGTVKVTFRGWPIPGAQSSDGTAHWWPPTYFYDPVFYPGGADAHGNPTPPPMAKGPATQWLQVNQPIGLWTPFTDWGSFSLNPQWFGSFASGTSGKPVDSEGKDPSIGYKLHTGDAGFDSSLWNTNVGGTARPGRALWKKQYWESHIKSVPSAVPPSSSKEHDPFQIMSSPSWFMSGGDGFNTQWPKNLNTFLNPVIGLWPRCKQFSKWNIIGLDPPDCQYRSIGVTRTSSMRGDATLFGAKKDIGGDAPTLDCYVVNDYSWIESTTTGHRPPWYLGDPGSTTVCTQWSLALHDYGSIDGINTFDNGTDITQENVFEVCTVYGPGGGGTIGTPPTESPGEAALGPIGGGGSFTYDPSTGKYVSTGGSFFPNGAFDITIEGYGSDHTVLSWKIYDYRESGHGGGAPGGPDANVKYTNLYGDLFYAPDIDLGENAFFSQQQGGSKGDCAFGGDPGVVIPFGADPGFHGPVFKGRADCLNSIKSPSRHCPINATRIVPDDGRSPLSGLEVPANGVWTGVDLGSWGVDDVIMICTDTTSRKVWFGINGRWIGPNGTDADPVAGTGWACYMDGPDASDPLADANIDARNYYPGVSFRLGETIIEQVTQTSKMKYPIPKGFRAFAARYGP